jgi:hypothetical protein
MALNLGPGFQAWIAANQATPISDENYLNSEMSVAIVKVGAPDGNPVPVLLLYNVLTNEVLPFASGS